MRTTVDLDEDILGVVKQLAAQQRTSAGKVLSDLARKALVRPEPPKTRNGIPLVDRLPGSPVVTMEMVNRWREEE